MPWNLPVYQPGAVAEAAALKSSGLSNKGPYGVLVSSTVSLITPVEKARKITVEIPTELLDKAQRASGAGITQTIRTGLQLVAASQTYAKLRAFRGKVRFARSLADLKDDR